MTVAGKPQYATSRREARLAEHQVTVLRMPSRRECLAWKLKYSAANPFPSIRQPIGGLEAELTGDYAGLVHLIGEEK